MVGFDLETTGVNVAGDRIVQAALVRINPGKRPDIKTWLVNPQVEIPTEAAAVHGITTERAVAEGGDPGQMLFELTGQLALALGRGIPVVTMNGSFDLSMLEVENYRHGIDALVSRMGPGGVQPIVDVLVLDKQADPYRKGGRRLEQLCDVYKVRHTGAHDAAADALAVCRIWPRIMAKHAKKLRAPTMGSLHQAQVGWKKTQMDGLRDYFDRQGTVHDGCCGEWPLHRACLPALAAVGGAA